MTVEKLAPVVDAVFAHQKPTRVNILMQAAELGRVVVRNVLVLYPVGKQPRCSH